jgi:hypothetical protein
VASAVAAAARSGWEEWREPVPSPLVPGGVFCGSDNPGRGLRFRLIHLGDNRTVVDPATLGGRLHAAGFEQARIRTGSRIVFHAYRPG